MALLFVLKKNLPELAAAEAKAAVYGWKWWQHKEKANEGTLYFPKARKPPQELALTRSVVNVIATCSPTKIRQELQKINWNRHLAGKSFRFLLTKQLPVALQGRELAAIIWKRLKKPKVNLVHPDIIVEIIVTGKRAYIGFRAKEYTGDFAERRAHLLPAPHPTGAHPTLARALINVACAKTVHDPFCGSGGFLIEAGLAGLRISGGDIEPKMIARAKTNCRAFGFRPDLRVIDATSWLPRVQAVVTDLPYGKGTKPRQLKSLVDAFLERALSATNRIVVGLPHELHTVKGWKIRGHFSQYIHKQLTRHFYVLERKP